MKPTENELGTYSEQLLSKLTELQQGAHRLERIAVETAPDILENLQLASEREVAITKLDRDAVLMAAIRAALVRISDGTYGECLDCGEKIRRGRLSAAPWASYCIRCQEAKERVGEASLSSEGASSEQEAA